MLSEVLAATGSREHLRGLFRRTGVRYASHFRKWLQLGVDHHTGLAVEWVSAQQGYQSQTLPPDELRIALDAVREAYTAETEEDIDAVGTLYSYNSSSRHFSMSVSLADPETGEVIEKVIHGSVHSSVPVHIEVPQTSEVRLHGKVNIDPITGDEHEDWILLRLGPDQEKRRSAPPPLR